jgi:hypothetical protein
MTIMPAARVVWITTNGVARAEGFKPRQGSAAAVKP